MTESGGGGLGSRFFSGLGALGNILRLSTGSQIKATDNNSSDNDTIESVDEAVATAADTTQQGDEIEPAKVEHISGDDDVQLTQEEFDNIEYEGQTVINMKYIDIKNALKREGCKIGIRQTKKESIDILVKIAQSQAKNGGATKSHDPKEFVDRTTLARSTPSKQTSRAAVGVSASAAKMSTRRSAAEAGPPSSRLRNRSPPPISPIIEKRKVASRTPSTKPDNADVSGKRERKKSHIFNDEYELSGTAKKKQQISASSSSKKSSVSRTKQTPSKKVPVSSAKKESNVRSSAVGLDEIGNDRAYGIVARNRESSEEDEEDEQSEIGEIVEAPIQKVISRADYQLSLSKAPLKAPEPEPEPVVEMGIDEEVEVEEEEEEREQEAEETEEVEEEYEGMDVDMSLAHPAPLEHSTIPLSEADDVYRTSEDESFFPGDTVPSRDEDGADADAEDEDEEGEDEEEEEEDKITAPYDEVAEGDDEYENTAEEEEEEEEEENDESVEVDSQQVVAVQEEEEEEDDDNFLSEDQSSEEEEVSPPMFCGVNAGYGVEEEGGVVDLVSDEEENEDAGAVGTDGDEEEDEGNNESFLTADTNEPVAKPTTLLSEAVSAPSVPAPKVPKKVVDAVDSVQDAVNTVLSAFKSSLSAKDFQHLQQMMGKEVPAPLSPVEVQHVEAPIISQSVDHGVSEAVGAESRKRKDRDTRMSGDGVSWTSRESFLPPSPHDRFAAPAYSASATVVMSTNNEVKVSEKQTFAHTTMLSAYREPSNVRFEEKIVERDSERKSLSASVSSHIRYGPVAFMRRPMTPFAHKTAASPSPSPFNNPPYEGALQGGAGGNSRQQQMNLNLPFPSTEEQLRKRRYEDSPDQAEQGGAKRFNLGQGQSRYSVGSYEQIRPAFTPLDNGAQGAGFTPGIYKPDTSRASYSSYTPMFKDNSSRGVFSGVLLQPSQAQAQARRGSLSFAQRRQFQRQSEEGQGLGLGQGQSSSAPLAAAYLERAPPSSSAYASASVAKRILDTLSELQTPMDEARHRPLAVTAALSASKDALARSERVPLDAMKALRASEAATAISSTSKPLQLSFPVVASVGEAAVASASSAFAVRPFTLPVPTPAPAAATIPLKNTWMSSSSSGVTSALPPAKSMAPAPFAVTATEKAPKTPTVRFQADSEFTFGDPSEVEGVDQMEMERLLSPPGTLKKEEMIKFAFSPPGKNSKSVEKRKSVAPKNTEGAKSGMADWSSPAPVVVQAAQPVQESLWSKAISAAADTQKCPSCYVQNPKTATTCASCENSLKGTGGPASATPAIAFAPSATTAVSKGFQMPVSSGFTFSATPAAAAVAPIVAPVVTSAPAKASLWAMAAVADTVKCSSCYVQNPKGSLKCLSCETPLGQPATTVSAPLPAPTTPAPFTFGGPVIAAKPAAVTLAPVPAAIGTSPGPFTSSGTGFSFGATGATPVAPLVMPPASATFTGFFGAAAPTPTPSATTTAANPFSISSSVASAAAPSSSGAGAAGAAAPISAVVPSLGGFQGFGAITAPAAAITAPKITFGAPASTTLPTALPATLSTPAFSFGSIPSTSTPSASLTVPAFSFGAPKAATTAAATSTPAPAPFVFGSVATAPKAADVPGTTGFVMPAFSFGNTASIPASAPAVASVPPPFTFGGSSAPAPFMFGASSAATTPVPASSFSSGPAAHVAGSGFGMDSPSSTMDTGYTSGDASNIGFAPALMNSSFGAAAPFTFGAPVSNTSMGSSMPPFEAPSQPFGTGSAPFGMPNTSQPFSFGAPQSFQVQTQQQPFGFAPGIAGGAGFGQPQGPAFIFGGSQASNLPNGAYGSVPQTMQSMGAAAGVGGFSMGASSDTTGKRKKVKAKRPGGQ